MLPPGTSIDDGFRPPVWLRNAHLQSILPSLQPRRRAVRRRARVVLAASEPLLLDCGEGVRLLCERSPGRGGATGSTVILLHGWEGSSDSLYVLSLAQELFARGFGVVRLNLRDHGPTHHLNPELFHSNRLPEVVGAVAALRRRFPDSPLALAGFSLGGNFALRVAADPQARSIGLEGVVAVSPVLDPTATLHAMEHGFALYERYFIWKWSESLERKAAAWPGRYDFSSLRGMNLRRMTDELVRHHTSYTTLESYLQGYAVTGPRLAALACPALLITALDDPIIPADDLARLHVPAALRLVVTRCGGHCGFLESLSRPSWADRLAVAALEGWMGRR